MRPPFSASPVLLARSVGPAELDLVVHPAREPESSAFIPGCWGNFTPYAALRLNGSGQESGFRASGPRTPPSQLIPPRSRLLRSHLFGGSKLHDSRGEPVGIAGHSLLDWCCAPSLGLLLLQGRRARRWLVPSSARVRVGGTSDPCELVPVATLYVAIRSCDPGENAVYAARLWRSLATDPRHSTCRFLRGSGTPSAPTFATP